MASLDPPRRNRDTMLSTATTAVSPEQDDFKVLTPPPTPQQDVAALESQERPSPSGTDWKPSPHQLTILLTLALISLMISLDATIIVTTLSSITSALGITATQAFWIGTSYLLTCAVTMPFLAALSDIFGRTWVLLSSLVFFTAGTILCCRAVGIAVLLVGRCVQGIGGGGVIILALVITTDIVPLRHRPKWFGVIQGAWALGTCTGPIIGAAFVQHDHSKDAWRWIFYIMFPFCFIGFLAIPFVLTLKTRTTSLKEKLVRVDWFGGFLFISSSTSFLIAVSWGGTQEPWGSWRTYVALVLGATGIVVSLLWEGYGAKEPFLKRSLFYNISSYAAYFGAMIQGLLLYSQLYYIPFYFLSVHQDSPVRTGVSILPVTLTLVPGSVVAGVVITRLGRFRWAIWGGWAVTTLACGLTIIWNIHTRTGVWAIILIILGLGHAMVLNSQNFATQAICRKGDEGSAAAMYAFLRSFGMALGVGLGGSIFQNVMKIKLAQLGLPADIAQNAEAFVATLRAMPESPTKTGILQAYVYGFRGVYGSFCGIAGLAGIVSIFIKHHNMDKELDSEHKLQENRFSRILNENNRLSLIAKQLGSAREEKAGDVTREKGAEASRLEA